MRRSGHSITLFAVIGLGVALAGCAQKQPPAGGSSNSRAEKARKDAESLAVNAMTTGAQAQAQAVPEAKAKAPNGASIASRESSAPKTTPRPGAPAVVRERIRSTMPYLTEAEAEEDALAQARALVIQKLSELDPPVRYQPSLAEVKAEYLRKDSRTLSAPNADVKDVLAQTGLTGNRVYVEYDVEISADQVRELRSQERVGGGLRVLGALFAVALAGFLFLRADEWTKGYLTRWLALGAVMLAGAAAAALVFI